MMASVKKGMQLQLCGSKAVKAVQRTDIIGSRRGCFINQDDVDQPLQDQVPRDRSSYDEPHLT